MHPSRTASAAPNGTLCFNPIRIVPFDVGAPLTATSFSQLARHLKGHPGLRSTTVSEREHAVTGAESIQFEIGTGSNGTLTLDCYQDGYGIFTIYDSPYFAPDRKFGPHTVLQWRRDQHNKLLTGSHSRSGDMHSTMVLIWQFMQGLGIPLRRSASSTWSRSGISYIMTIHSVVASGSSRRQRRLIEDVRPGGPFFNNVMYLLEPSISGLVEKHLSGDTFWIPNSKAELRNVVASRFNENSGPGRSIEIRSDAMVYANWGNVYIFSPEDEKLVEDYIFTEKRIQHLWFRCFALNEVFQEGNEEARRGRYRYAQNLWRDSSRAIHDFRRFVDPSLSNRHQVILEELIRTSRVDKQMALLESHIKVTRSAAEIDIADRERQFQRRVAILLVLLTVIQVLGVILQIVQAVR